MARPAPASARATDIVSFLTAHPSRGFTISELVTHLGMNIASAHATLAVLCDSGFVVRDPVHRTYVLGPALAVTGFATLEQHPAIGAAVEQAEVLGDELGTEISVMAAAGRDVIFLARRGPVARAQVLGYPGDRTPMLAPIGAVFLAWAEDEAVSGWLERATLTPALRELYRRVLGEIRDRGYSVPLASIAAPAVIDAIAKLRDEPTDADAEHRLAEVLAKTDEMLLSFESLTGSDKIVVKTVAAPVFDPMGRVLLSLSITGPDHAIAVEDVIELGRRLVQSATIATRQARGRIPGRDLPPTGTTSAGRRR
ncbi:IclR family transcriptional regulator [Pseudofrankia inefficax]|uniref:Transcriptional regulator, IclR family n=1 Tax=Pseudofrankia inefficax (strain DSM 45817 / CECT 9037 / DDB 130130 / EuI1c) TaxID=298654 RepID=E3IU62_PSEI1|nr:helix-turn-helix domain-containing protein [Pseudofrankia inefficax]ADP82399.1 transcriptional regulator, IclR family [Pseudofrankia inefficax]